MKYICPKCYKLYDRETDDEWICTECPEDIALDWNPPSLIKLEDVTGNIGPNDVWLFEVMAVGGIFYQWGEPDLRIFVNKKLEKIG